MTKTKDCFYFSKKIKTNIKIALYYLLKKISITINTKNVGQFIQK
jgi:hypothetical protein